MKNVTLSAEAELIEAAREKARRRSTSLNAEFREWLRRYAESGEGPVRVRNYRRLMEAVSGASSGRRFSRDEMNER